MTKEELDKMHESIVGKRTFSDHLLWAKAFKEYNEVNTTKLSMGCKTCYQKVFNFLYTK